MLNSNLYAEKIYAANPAILWALDDTISGTPSSLSTIALSSQYGIPAYAYGRPTDYGYYVSPDNTLANVAALNDGIPMVFGATNITTIYNNSNSPALIVPGFGFLNNSGKYKSYTLEFWIRVNSDSHYPRKIVGPINSNDGLYVEGGFLKLKIGDSIGSHYVGEWGRPMIVHITYNEYSASLLINGEQVATLALNSSIVTFPNKNSSESKDQDWIGFYAYDNVTPVQIDCIAIYPYVISARDAKLHFVWGQAVESPELKNAGYSDVPIIFDYQMSKAANNYTYPGTGRWKNGTYNNLGLDNNRVTVPQYSLPEIIFEDKTKSISGWNYRQGLLQSYTTTLSDGQLINNDVYFKMDPQPEGLEWYSNGYISFPSMNILNDNVKGIYGVFEVDTDAGLTTEQLLFSITDKNKKSFEVTLNSSGVLVYSLKQYTTATASTTIVSYTESAVVKNQKFVAGIDIANLSADANIQDFFNNRSTLSIQLAARADFSNMFFGKIYKFGFINSQNMLKVSSYFSDGIVDQTKGTEFNEHIASYTLFGLNTMNSYSLDIAVNGTWQDYVPLRVLAKEVITNTSGDKSYSLDFLQFNVDYPELSNITNSTVRSYVAFANLATYTPENLQISRANLTTVTSNKVIEATSDITTRRYEVKNDTIIYPPSGLSVNNLAMITYLEFFVPGIIRNQIQIRNLHISSRAFDHTSVKTPIGTKYGKDFFSYKIADSVKDFAGKSPFSIYKNSTPYLYLTKYSGIRLVGSSIDATRGLEIPVNKFAAAYYKVGFIQASALYDQNFTTTEIELYRVSGTNIPDPYIVCAKRKGTNSNKAYIYVKKGSTILTDEDVTISINGVEITNAITDSSAIIRKNEWAMVGINFISPLNFSSVSDGVISITGPFLINNIADYQISEKDEKGVVFLNTWQDGIDAYETWDNVDDNSWEEIFFQTTSQTSVTVDGGQVYRSYIGSNRLRTNETLIPFSVFAYRYSIFGRVNSATKIVTPL